MQKITYSEAANILGVKYITIKHAVMYGRLTRCSVPEKQAMVLKEQVLLFKNKNRISEGVLDTNEKALWSEYKRIAENPELLDTTNHIGATQEQIIDQIIKNAVEEGIKAGKDDTIDAFLDIFGDRLLKYGIKRGIFVNPQMPQVHPAYIS